MSKRLDQAREAAIQPIRMQTAKTQITMRGFEIKKETATSIEFEHKGHPVTFFPYSGWHSGKTINDGRGLKQLLNQLEK